MRSRMNGRWCFGLLALQAVVVAVAITLWTVRLGLPFNLFWWPWIPLSLAAVALPLLAQSIPAIAASEFRPVRGAKWSGLAGCALVVGTTGYAAWIEVAYEHWQPCFTFLLIPTITLWILDRVIRPPEPTDDGGDESG